MLPFHKSPTDSPSGTFEIKNMVNKLQIMSSNILYLTHEVDQIKKIVQQISNNTRLQKQVDEFFEDSTPEEEVVKNGN